jgi:opacity protein-like surface antigen
MRKSLFLLFFLVYSASLHAQFFIAGGHFNGGFPVSKLKQEVDKTFFPTISGILLYEFYNQPLQVGLELGYGIYGTKVETRDDFYPGFNEEYRLRRNNNYTSGMLVFRFLPSMTSRVTPFFEIQAGANYLYSKFKIRPSIFEETVEVGKDMEDWSFGYKIGGGMQFPIPGLDGGKIELRVNYQDGNSIRFLTKPDTQYLPNKGDGEFEYSPRQSPLQLITGSVGIVVYDAFR